MHSFTDSSLAPTLAPLRATSHELAYCIPRAPKLPHMPTTDELEAHYNLLDHLQELKDACAKGTAVGRRRR